MSSLLQTKVFEMAKRTALAALSSGLLVLPALPSPALAATGAVTFNGTVTSSCAITVTNGSGTMTPDPTLKTLSSHNTGGSAGALTLTTTGNVTVSLDPVSAVSVPAADSTATTWVPSYSMTGAQTVPDTSVATAIAGSGTNTLAVHLTGTKTGTNTFKNGAYAATVTVRCE